MSWLHSWVNQIQTQVLPWVSVPVPALTHTHKPMSLSIILSLRTSKLAKNWLRYHQNNVSWLFWPYLSQFLANLDVLRLILKQVGRRIITCICVIPYLKFSQVQSSSGLNQSLKLNHSITKHDWSKIEGHDKIPE